MPNIEIIGIMESIKDGIRVKEILMVMVTMQKTMMMVMTRRESIK